MIHTLIRKSARTCIFVKFSAKIVLITILATFLVNCQWGPKERELEMPKQVERTGKAIDDGLTYDLHQVRILELQPTDSYTYLKVEENNKAFWIATGDSDVKVDSIYYYRESLLKKNFKSKQLNREFDSIYLVTRLVSETHFKDLQEY